MQTAISKLTTVDLRQVWANEAINFTPWLADNIDHLAEALDMELELVGNEVAVDSFSADILAQDITTGQRVLIENQLERSDHRHLGQIMTYLAGLKAKTVIWVAPEFAPAHLSALKWLNEHTPDDLAFFAIALKAVRIGDSPFAPVFEVQIRPDSWARQIQKSASSSEAARTEIRAKFWQAFANRHPGSIIPQRTSNIWVPLQPDGSVQLSMYISLKQTGFFVRGGSGADHDIIHGFMAKHGARLSAALGCPHEPNTSRGFYFGHSLDITLHEQDRWPEAIDWLEENRKVFLSVFSAIQA